MQAPTTSKGVGYRMHLVQPCDYGKAITNFEGGTRGGHLLLQRAQPPTADLLPVPALPIPQSETLSS